MNELSAALQSGSILLREGLEALLVVAALAAFLTRAGVPEKVKPLYLGAGIAIAASIGAAVVFELFFEGNHNDYMEAGVLVIAAVLMLYMSGWMYLRQDPKAWMSELRGHAERALDSGTTLSLAAIFYAMQKLALMLPLRPVFLVTSAFLFIMGLRFVGAALNELQERTVVSVTPAPVPDWLVALGVNPTWEAIGAQIVIALIAVASTAALRARRPSPPKDAPVAAE